MGAGMQMFSHGVMTALFFAVVGMVYDRTHTRDIANLGGLFRKMPYAAVGSSLPAWFRWACPDFSGFAAEFPIFHGGVAGCALGGDHRYFGCDYYSRLHSAGCAPGVLW
jgi:NADH:ubiquinone oxidoreductase subunit 4 (subunit M)